MFDVLRAPLSTVLERICPMADTRVRKPRLYNAIWRWHFYAGIFCIPFVIWLAVTGSIYLWRPQIEAWLDRPYTHLEMDGPIASPEAQLAAASRAVPGSELSRYQLPEAPDAATQILMKHGDVTRRVYVHPVSAAVLKVEMEDQRPLRVVSRLHGDLMAGAPGSYLVEIAACWAIVMILTGLYLWWPRGNVGLAGVIYPRLRRGGRVFWRDIHATTGIWVSGFALVLIMTGLPWAKAWGGYLGEIRQMTGTAKGPVDWTIGGKKPQPDGVGGDHAGMHMSGMVTASAAWKPGELDGVIATVAPAGIAPPVQIAPPIHAGAPWRASSEAADRPQRSEIGVDGTTGAVVSRTGFADRHVIDRVIGYGIAVHEGALFGLFNQIVGTITALFLIVLAVSGAIMWWRRRPVGLLGAPVPLARARFGRALVASVVVLGLYMPMFGATLLIVLAAEHFVLARLPKARRWLGLRGPAAT